MSATQLQPTQDPFLGQLIGGRYRVIKLLGEGGMGAVYQAEQMIAGTAKKFAIKTLHPQLSKDPMILARFERECGTVAGLSHPNLIQLVDFGKTVDGTLYMVMEFVEGRSLGSLLEEKGSLDPRRASHILQQLCDALAEAHARGIVHRDLKPDNIVLTERAKDFVKVLDFGIAKRGEDALAKAEQKLTQQGTVLGTPPYMSPEQFTGKTIDLRSDLYSIGVIAYEMLAGRLPFSANTPWEWATQHMTVPPAALTTSPRGEPLPVSMRAAVMKALEKDPQHRFGSATELYEAFASEASPPTTGPTPNMAPPQPGRTEIGTPIGLAAGMGGAPPVAGYASAGYTAANPAGASAVAGHPPTPAYPPQYGAPPQQPVPPYYTPAAGNVAFPTPVGVAPPPRQGGGKTGLIVGLLALMLVCVGALALGLRGRFGASAVKPPAEDLVEAGTLAAVDTSTPASPDADVPIVLDTSIAPLTNGNKAPPVPPAVVHHDAGAVKPPPPPGPANPPPKPPVQPSPPPQPPQPPATATTASSWKAEPKECAAARNMAMAAQRNPNLKAIYQELQTTCRNKGGNAN